jgi:CheY-like chemotaxis protein
MSASLTGIRVVVVEDHGDSREILEQMLGFYGAVVTTVSTASDALTIAPDADIIVTDFALPPGEDGVWLLEQVNGQPRPIPVVLVSGFEEHQDGIQSRSASLNGTKWAPARRLIAGKDDIAGGIGLVHARQI